MRSLINHQTQFISFVMGGPGTSYTDDALLRVHAPLHITAAELDRDAQLLRETLEDHGFAAPTSRRSMRSSTPAVVVNDR
jgi:hemoglobin